MIASTLFLLSFIIIGYNILFKEEEKYINKSVNTSRKNINIEKTKNHI